MENIRLAFQGIWSHKLRSFLTMLGIIIGIAAIITIVSTIKGTNEQIKQNLVGSGNNMVVVQLYQDSYPFDLSYNEPPAAVRPVTEETRQALEQLDGVERVSLFHSRESYSLSIRRLSTNFSGTLYGVDTSYFPVSGYRLTMGRDFLDADYETNRKVVILDQKAVEHLFQDENPIGQVLEIKQEPFTVIGVVEQANAFEPHIETIEDYYLYADTASGAIFIPDSTWPILFRFDEPQSVAVRATSTDAMTKAGKNVADALTASQIAAPSQSGSVDPETGETIPAGSSAFSYQSQDRLEQAQKLQDISNATNQQLIWIASISLLVGGIGVMNIMLVSVTERTSEIGLKKALGAKRRRILYQFLTEASVLTCLGGIVGVLVGIGLAELISHLNEIPVAISIPSIAVSVVFSVLIGVVFGMLPAVKAANLSPIDALRRD